MGDESSETELEERLSQLEKVFFTGLELLIGTGVDKIDQKKIDSLFDAYDKVVGKKYEDDEEFLDVMRLRNNELRKFREYIKETFQEKGDFDREFKEVRAEILDIMLGDCKVDSKKVDKLCRELRKLDEKKDLGGIEEKLAGFDDNSLIRHLPAAFKNKNLKSNIGDISDRVGYYSQLCSPFLNESRLANALSHVGSIVTEIYLGVCDGEFSFSGVVGDVAQIMNSKAYD